MLCETSGFSIFYKRGEMVVLISCNGLFHPFHAANEFISVCARQAKNDGSGKGLAPDRRQAITRTHANPVHLRMYAALGEMSVEWPWNRWVHRSQESTRKSQYRHNKAQQTLNINRGIHYHISYDIVSVIVNVVSGNVSSASGIFMPVFLSQK